MAVEYADKHKPEFVPLDEWSVEKDGEYTAEHIEAITAFGETLRGILEEQKQ